MGTIKNGNTDRTTKFYLSTQLFFSFFRNKTSPVSKEKFFIRDISRIYLDQRRRSVNYTLLHESAHQLQFHTHTYRKIFLGTTFFLSLPLINNLTRSSSLWKNIPGHLLSLGIPQLAQNVLLKIWRKGLVEVCAEYKTHRHLDCISCLRERAAVTCGFPYTSRQKLLKKAHKLKRNDKDQPCPFHQKETYKKDHV